MEKQRRHEKDPLEKEEMSPFGQRLIELLEEQNITDAEFAEKLTLAGAKTAQSTVTGYFTERDDDPIYCKRLRLMAQTLNVSVDYLVGNSKHKNPDINFRKLCDGLGLSELAIKVLRYHKNRSKEDPMLSIIEFLLEEEVPERSAFQWGSPSEEMFRRIERWEKKNYIQVLSAIEKYLTIPDLGKGRHFVVEDSIFDMFDRSYDYDAEEFSLLQEDFEHGLDFLRLSENSSKLNYTEVLEEVALSDIKQKLKEFKEKVHSSPKRYAALEPYLNPLPPPPPKPLEVNDDGPIEELIFEVEMKKVEARAARIKAQTEARYSKQEDE